MHTFLLLQGLDKRIAGSGLSFVMIPERAERAERAGRAGRAGGVGPALYEIPKSLIPLRFSAPVLVYGPLKSLWSNESIAI